MNKYVDALLILNALRFSEHNFTHYCQKTNALINYEVFRLTDNVLAALRPYLCFKNASTAHIAWMSDVIKMFPSSSWMEFKLSLDLYCLTVECSRQRVS